MPDAEVVREDRLRAARVRVSRRIREEFENGRDYYARAGQQLAVPALPSPPPSPEYLEWHSDVSFGGRRLDRLAWLACENRAREAE